MGSSTQFKLKERKDSIIFVQLVNSKQWETPYIWDVQWLSSRSVIQGSK
jgi:hypothetical protein